MSTHNIQFHYIKRKFPQIFVLLGYQKNFVVTQKQVLIIQAEQAIGVLVIKVFMYTIFTLSISTDKPLQTFCNIPSGSTLCIQPAVLDTTTGSIKWTMQRVQTHIRLCRMLCLIQAYNIYHSASSF